jgi:hypothetical protein
MRSLIVVALGASLSVSASLSMWIMLDADPSPWVEVVDGTLVRTSAAEPAVNSAVEELLSEFRPASGDRSSLDAARYEQHADAWFSSPDWIGQKQERARRLVREQLDREGHPMRVEHLSGSEMPAMVFIDHDSADSPLAARLAELLESRGCRRL